MTYIEFINKLNELPSKQKQVEYIMNYFLKHVQYDYATLEICNFDNNLLDLIDNTYNPAIAEDRQNAVQLVKSKGYSDEFIKKILEHYGESFVVPARPERVIMGKINKEIPEHSSYRTFASAKNMAKPSVQYLNNIIVKGVCADFSDFIKKVCDELNIDCYIVNGATPIAHVWNVIDVGEGLKHYDITYAIFSRDNYNGWNKTEPTNWFDITKQELLILHPTRVVDNFIKPNKLNYTN